MDASASTVKPRNTGVPAAALFGWSVAWVSDPNASCFKRRAAVGRTAPRTDLEIKPFARIGCLIGLALIAPVCFAAVPANPAAPAGDIRPIRGAVEIPEPPQSPVPMVLAVLGGVVLVALLVALGIWLKRRAEARRIPGLRQRAVKALEKAKGMMDPERSREYSIAVSGIVREFIEGRFKLPSTRRTTEEFMEALSEGDTVDLGPYRETLDHFLHLCDLGKFAGYKLAREEMENLHAAALDVVRCEATSDESGKSRKS